MARPKLDINPNQIIELASLGHPITDIARIVDCSPETIHGRFSSEISKGKSLLKNDLRVWQLNAAKQGNTSILIWLGKQYLQQTDTTIDKVFMNVLESSGMTIEDVIDLIKIKMTLPEAKRKTFHEFCLQANYPTPFEKQIEMVDFVLKENDPRLLLGARGTGKTDYALILGLSYDLYLNPLDSTNLIVTKSKERNASILNEIRNACELNGIKFDKANSNFLRVAGMQGKDHSVSAVTLGTVTLRGRHPKRTVMDDPVTEDDTSDATRKKAEKKYNEIMKLCTNVVVIGQPAHKFDLYAKLRGIVKKLEVPHGMIPELDHDLEVQRLAGVDESSIQASYFLSIQNEGSTPFDKIKYVDEFPLGNSSVAFIDPSHEGGDYTALSIVKGYMGGIVVVGFVWKKAWNHCLDEMISKITHFNVQKVAFETNSLGSMPLDILRTNLPNGIGVIGRRSNNNKHSRIMAAGAFAETIHLSRQSDKTYINQVVQYEYKAKHDDAPDSLATCLEWVGLVRGKK